MLSFLRHLKAIACSLALGPQLTATAAESRPAFSPEMLRDAKRLFIAARPMPPTYVVWQTTLATPGLAKDWIDADNKSNTSNYSKAVSELPENRNLYEHFLLQLSEGVQLSGFEVVRGIHDHPPMSCNPKEMEGGGSDWIFCIDGLMIRYYANTVLSGYMPQTNVVIVPYNVRTNTLFQPIVVKSSVEPKDGSFGTANALMVRLSSSFSALEATAENAAHLAVERLVRSSKK